MYPRRARARRVLGVTLLIALVVDEYAPEAQKVIDTVKWRDS
jgi:hypothetical protein